MPFVNLPLKIKIPIDKINQIVYNIVKCDPYGLQIKKEILYLWNYLKN